MATPIESKAIQILRTYKGSNDYILQIKKDILTRNYLITRNQAKYILEASLFEPKMVEKFVDIHPHYGEMLTKQFGLGCIPKKIYIKKILFRKNDQLHIFGKPSETFPYNDFFYLDKFAFPKLNEVPKIDWNKYKRQPKSYQIPAIEALIAHDKFILADDMGLGKTTSAVLAALERGFQRILIVCTATLKLNWKREIEFYDDPKNISVISGKNWETNKWVILNYNILDNFHHTPIKGVKTSDLPISPIDYANFDLVIADEAHYLKTASSIRTKIFTDFSSRIKCRWFLTGTPITNRPIDFYSLLKLCDSPIAQNWVHFVKKYCAGKQFYRKKPFGTEQISDKKEKYWVTSGASNLDDLHFKTKDMLLRRLKKDHADLPPKLVDTIYLDMERSTMYNKYLDEYNDDVSKSKKVTLSDHLTKLIRIRQMLSYDKVEYTIALAEDMIENGKKVIIFSVFTESLLRIYEHFNNKAVIIDGSVSKEKRQGAVDEFQNNDKILVFCGNLIAAGVGITLTKAEVVIFNDLDWIPSNHDQAEDRPYRIGQENAVNVFYMLFEDTLDTLMYDELDKKRKIIEKILGDESGTVDSEDLQNSVASEVVKKLLQKIDYQKNGV